MPSPESKGASFGERYAEGAGPGRDAHPGTSRKSIRGVVRLEPAIGRTRGRVCDSLAIASARSAIPDLSSAGRPQALRKAAAQDGMLLLDVQQLAEQHVTLFTDECHFTELGHQLAAKLFAQHLAPLL
ncbi:MAG TPA: hypothetical protein VF384_17465 [Planctomycetota bacterium]